MNKLVLDYSKWRCGGDFTDAPGNQLGEGPTMLLNEQGFMCCLGQFSLQLDTDLDEYDICNLGEPADLDQEVTLLCYTEGDVDPAAEDDEHTTHSTILSDKAIAINDDGDTTPEEKIAQLRELFGAAGYEIEVINKN